MLLVASVILPVFGISVLGYGLVALRILPLRLARLLSGFVYWVAIPAILFRSMSVNGPHLSGKLDLLAAYYLGALILFTAGIALARYVWRYDLARQGLVGFNLCFGNTVQIGVPLMLAALGPEGLANHTLIVASHAILLLNSGDAGGGMGPLRRRRRDARHRPSHRRSAARHRSQPGDFVDRGGD